MVTVCCFGFLPFHAVFHYLSRWMCCIRGPMKKKQQRLSLHYLLYMSTPAACSCSEISLPLGVSLNLLNPALWFVSSYVWQGPSSRQSKVGQSRSIRVLYKLRLSLLGHKTVVKQEAHRCYVCYCQKGEKGLFYVYLTRLKMENC